MDCLICEQTAKNNIPPNVHLEPHCISLYHNIAIDRNMACPRCGFHRVVTNG